MASTDPRTATEAQWQDLANRVKEKAKITMTTTDPGEGSALAENNYIGVYGGDPIIMDYSTSEVNTGMKWIDGSVIYKKTIDFGNLPNNTLKAVNHNIIGMSQVIKIEGAVYKSDSSNNEYYPLPLMFRGADSSYNVQITVNNTDVAMSSTTDRSMFTAYITLYYTKSS